jgi:hypothetical protein
VRFLRRFNPCPEQQPCGIQVVERFGLVTSGLPILQLSCLIARWMN